jgi:hypothetical protein
MRPFYGGLGGALSRLSHIVLAQAYLDDAAARAALPARPRLHRDPSAVPQLLIRAGLPCLRWRRNGLPAQQALAVVGHDHPPRHD